MKLIGIDTGGTFTDFIFYENAQLRVHKVLSTPHAPDVAILQGLSEMQIDYQDLKIIHGTTVATNAVLEGKGVSTVYITNHGLRDVLRIGRQARNELYNLQPEYKPHLVSEELCLETGGRLSANGEIIEDLSDEDIQHLVQQVVALDPQAVAINLLFSFLNENFEKRIADAIPQKYFVSRSSEVLPEYKEYERGMATWLNAYVGPLVKHYLNVLNQAVAPANLSVMLSTGGTASTEQAGNKAVNMLLSGPAGGLQAAKFIGEQLAIQKMLTFDMGGTSTDVALIDGEIKLTNEAKINNIPIAVPMVDMHTIGAGGGSIAHVDAGGLLQVGPQSAGAEPGPACYGKGGQNVTVTDANLVLGYLPEDMKLGGYLSLDKHSSVVCMQKLAKQLHCSVEQAADGVLQLANEHMAQALRVISVQKGFDPREFSLLSFGGAGALHVCELAEKMMMRQAVVPLYSGVLSAFGMLVAPVSRELSVTHIAPLNSLSEEDVIQHFHTLEAKGLSAMRAEGVDLNRLQFLKSLDLRYLGQSFTLNVPWRSIPQSIADFHETHNRRYGHKLEEEIELVNIRVSIKSPTQSLKWQNSRKKQAGKPINYAKVYACEHDVPVYTRDSLVCEQCIEGPAIIIEEVATTFVKKQWMCRVHETGHLILTFSE